MTRRAGVVGRRVRRHDGPAKVFGQAAYPEDLAIPADCLHAATVRAPVAAGRIRRLDLTPALGVPGVVRVLTAADVKGTNRFGLMVADQPVLADGVIRGASDVVALVLGTSARAARAGARRVGLEVEAAALLLDFERACDPGAPIIHPERSGSRRHPNLLAARSLRRGDAAAALRRSAIVIEGEYRTPFVEHAFLGPEAGLAVPGDGGNLVLHVATQWPEADLRQAAAALGEPLGGLRIVQTTIGGAFGGREDISLQLLLLLAARATGRPVRMAWDRAESIRGHGKRHPFRIRHRLGADRSGRLTGAEIDVLIDAGCYASTSTQLLDNALGQACGPYRIGAVALSGRAVFTHHPYTCAMRGFGVNQVTFAMEQQLNKLAVALGVDPMVLRRHQLIGPGDPLGPGAVVTDSAGLPKVLAAATRRAARSALPPDRGPIRHGRGGGLAAKNIGFGFGADDRATAEVVVDRRGVVVRIGAAEVGQGVATVLAQIAADTLGIRFDRVRIEWRDTGTAPEAGSSSASRQTLIGGNAVRRACLAARRRIETEGGLPPGGIRVRSTARGGATRPLGRGERARHWIAHSWGSAVADVAVDIETGTVTVLRVVNAIDAGRVIHPSLFAGQSEGGVVMGLGYALLEQCRIRAGLPISLGFEPNGVPTAFDAPASIETIAVESPYRVGPFGARGIGEITMIPVVPAITAAIYDACGVWIDELPATPARLRAAIAIRNRRLGRQRPQ